MTDDDLEVMNLDADSTVEQRARSAAAGARRATNIEAPAWDRAVATTRKTRLISIGVPVLVVLAVIAALIVSRSGPLTDSAATTPGARVARASQVVHDLAAGNYGGVTRTFDATLRRQLSTGRVRERWQLVVRGFGPVVSQAQPVDESSAAPIRPDGTLYYANTFTVPASMAGGDIDVMIGLDRDGRVAGLAMSPTGSTVPAPLDPAELESKAAVYVHNIVAGNDEAAIATIEQPFRDNVSVPLFQTAWQNSVRAYGAFRHQGTALADPTGQAVNVPLTWAHATGFLRVEFDPQSGQVMGNELLPPGSPTRALLGSLVPPTQAAQNLTTTIANDLGAGRYAAVTERFDTLIAARLTAAQLQETWDALTASLGTLQAVGPAKAVTSNPSVVWYEIGLTLQRGSVHVQVALDDQQRILNMNVRPGPPTGIIGQ